MKGITHFTLGVAVASCFPEAVRAGAAGNPLYFILGGLFGLLPDTLDFKFHRFLSRRDVEVTPDPLNPDAELIANAVAYAVGQAHRTRRPVRIKLNTVRLAADRWRRYTVRFDPERRRVTVEWGPEVNTSRREIAPGTPAEPSCASADLPCPITVEYQATTVVDIFDGPTFRMSPLRSGGIAVEFIPWHREWSHSLTFSLALGLAGAAILGTTAGMVIAGAHAVHGLTDQLGFLGSNLFYPLTRRRQTGLQKFRSNAAEPNLAFTWSALVLIFWNLHRGTAGVPIRISLLQAALFGALLPLGAVFGLKKLLRGRGVSAAPSPAGRSS